MVFAGRAGLTRSEIASLTHGHADDSAWTSGRERALIQVADALHDASDISDELWDSARAVLDEPQMLDLLMLCGWYHAVSFTARAARVDFEPGAPRFADAIP